MADFPLGGAQKWFTGDIGSTSGGVTLTASATPNTKGVYVEIDAVTEVAVSGINITFKALSIAANTQGLIDIAVGGAGSEVDILSNYHVELDTSGSVTPQYSIELPLKIAAGTRVTARWQTDSSSADTMQCMVTFKSPTFQSHPGYGAIVTYGAVTSTSSGTPVDAGGSSNTKGAWAELVDPCEGFKGFFLSIGGNGNSGANAARFLYDIGIDDTGQSGTEVVLVPNIAAESKATEAWTCYPGFIERDIPEGSRLVIRSQSSTTSAVDRILTLVFHGVK